MSDEDESAWSSRLQRSYSEHADIVLQHFGHHWRDAQSHRFSSLDFRLPSESPGGPPADLDDEHVPSGQRTWRVSSSPSKESKEFQHHRRNFDCGDSAALNADFSGLSLDEHSSQEPGTILKPRFLSSANNTRTTVSSLDLCSRAFENDDAQGFQSKDQQYQEDTTPRNEMDQVGSLTSLSSSSRRRLNGTQLTRQISYENWVREKKRELQRRKDDARRAEQRKAELEEQRRREQEDKQRRDYESRLARESRRKKNQQQAKKRMIEKEQHLRIIQDVKKMTPTGNIISWRQWNRKKDLQQKVIEKKQTLKQKKEEEEKQRRIEESVKAYNKWQEKAKYTARPATQGLLPHQKAKPAYTNPTPWQPLVDNASDDSDNESKSKPSSTTMKNQRYRRASIKR